MGDLTKKQKLIVGGITSFGVVGCYTGGVTLAKSFSEYHNPIFAGTIVISFISPYILYSTTTYAFRRFKDKKKKQLKK